MSKEIKKNIQNKAVTGAQGDQKRGIKFGQGNFLQDGTNSTQEGSTTTLGGGASLGSGDPNRKKAGGNCCQ